MAKPSAERGAGPAPDGVEKKTHSLICPWSSETIEATSRRTRRVWLSTMPKNGNVSGVMKTQSVSTKKLAVFVIFETNKHVAEAHEWARNLDLTAASVRKACLSFPSKAAIGLDQHAFKDIAVLPDKGLGSFGEIV